MRLNFLKGLLLTTAMVMVNLCSEAQLKTVKYQSAEVYPGLIRVQLKNEPAVIQKVETFQAELKAKTQGLKSYTPTEPVAIQGLETMNALNQKYTAKVMKRVFREAGKHEARHRDFGLHLWYDIELDARANLADVIAEYEQLSYVQSVNPHFVYELKSSLPNGANDMRLSEQWHYENNGANGGTSDKDIDLKEAWKIETGNANVVVAIEDGGIDINHPDLNGNIWVNPGEIANNNIDDDNNGYVDDVNGYNFAQNQGAITAHNHGTHVAGTVGAETNNGIGVAGIAGGSGSNDGVRLMSCQVFSNSGNNGFVEAFTYAADNGAVISQNSWGYTSPGSFDPALKTAIDYFNANAGGPGEAMQGGLVIVAAGNSNADGQYYPGYYDGVLAVASTNNRDVRASYSNYGTWVDIAAPGGETSPSQSGGVLSTLPNGSYGFYQGTSMACPHVSGVAALVVSKFYGTLTAAQLRQKLVNNVDPIDNLNPSYAGKLGSGRLNAYKSLTSGSGTNVPPTVSITNPVNGDEIPEGTTLTVSANANDTDGTVTRVEFFDGTTSIGVRTSAPYSISVSNLSLGSHTLKAIATDNENATGTSAIVSITITPGSGDCNAPQYVAGSNYGTGTEVKNNGKKYKCKVGGWCSSDAAWAYAPGEGLYWQDAWTDQGNCSGDNTPPTVAVTTPANGAVFTEGTTITINASATDSDGTVTKVAFFAGTTSIGTDTSSPYSINWSNASAGYHNITAVATDNGNASTTSAIISIEVTGQTGNTPPTVSISNPSDGATFTQGQTVAIQATASDTDGSVTKVEFFNGSTLLGTDTSRPYSINVNNLALGTHVLSVIATDNENATGTSSNVSITINPTGGCTAPQYVAGTGYATNSEVKNNGHLFRCKVGGWCSSSAAWAYEPGAGLYWGTAWEDLGTCTSQTEMTLSASSVLRTSQQLIYPNPFKNTATLLISLGDEAHVEFKLFNTQGTEVFVINKEQLAAGDHRIEINAAHLPAGLYIGQLILNETPAEVFKLHKE